MLSAAVPQLLQALVRGRERRIALGGNDLGVRRADIAEDLWWVRPKVIHGIRAEEREGMPEVGLQVVPEFFQAEGGGMAVRDEECDHLPEDSHLTPLSLPAR